MSKKLIANFIIITIAVVGVLCMTSLLGVFEQKTQSVSTAVWQESELSIEDGNLLVMQKFACQDIYACIRSNLRLPGSGSLLAGVRDNVRRRNSLFLFFAVLICTAFKRVAGTISAILFICMIFISYFYIQIRILHQVDGKKWRLSVPY